MEGNMRSQELRKQAPELDPLRLGTGWKREDLAKPQILIESSFGDSHPGSVHLLELAERPKREQPGKGDSGRDISARTSAMVKHRAMTV